MLGPDVDPRARDLLSQAHPSHNILTYKGLAWCRKCGNLVKFLVVKAPSLRGLREPCEPPSRYGQLNLNRLHHDPPQLPYRRYCWPEDAYQDFHFAFAQSEV